MFNDFLDVLRDEQFEEVPVDVKTFVESPDYLGQPPLSAIQYDIVEAMSQVSVSYTHLTLPTKA